MSASKSGADVVVFSDNDMLANVTFAAPGADGTRTGTYFEGSNIYVYIRGTSDEDGDWWRPNTVWDTRVSRSMRRRGVLVNAHFDS